VSVKVGDIVRVRLPHDERGGIPCLLVDRDPLWADRDNHDVWWAVIYDGELREVHQDYFREVISESR